MTVADVGWFTHNVFGGRVKFADACFNRAQFMLVAFNGPVDFSRVTFQKGVSCWEVFSIRSPEVAAACRWPEGWEFVDERSSSTDEEIGAGARLAADT